MDLTTLKKKGAYKLESVTLWVMLTGTESGKDMDVKKIIIFLSSNVIKG